jgi:putative ABC transport system permease protein
MFSITIQDLWFRARQFLIAVVGASLVFAMAVLLSGLAAGFSVEISSTIAGTGAEAWVMADGATGRLTALPPIQMATAERAEGALRAAGAGRVDPIIITTSAATIGTNLATVVVIGSPIGGLGAPTADSGRSVNQPGQAVVDSGLGIRIGQQFDVSGQRLQAVGIVNGRTLDGGTSEIFVPLRTAQSIAYGGRRLVGAIITSRQPERAPTGFSVRSDSEVQAATYTEVAPAVSSIQNTRLFMWFIAAVIVAALIYVTALERTRDFAILKALGSSSVVLFASLALEAVLVSLIAAAVAAGLANLMTGVFSQPVDIPISAFLSLPLAAIAVGLVSSLAAVRRAVSADPSSAFAGA